MQLQFSTACLPHTPLGSAFAAAQALQLESIELALTPLLLRRGAARITAQTEQYGLRVRSLDLTPLGELSLDPALVSRLAVFANELPGCQVVALPLPHDWHLLAGGMSSFLSLLSTYRQGLREEITLTLINAAGGNSETAGPLDRFAALRRVVEEWELGYTFSTSHAASAGWAITEPLPQMGKRLRNVHLSDFRPQMRANGNPVLLATQIQPWQLGRVPGEGVLPLRAFLRNLARRDYPGLITIQLHETGLRAWWPPTLTRNLLQTITFCRTALHNYQPQRPWSSYRTYTQEPRPAETENGERHA